MSVVAALVWALFGLVAGSWLHVVLQRSPFRQPLRRPLSHCTTCGVPTPGKQRAALVATARRERACATCGNDLWPGSPWFEIGAALAAGVVGLVFGFGPAVPAFVVFFVGLYTMTILDLRHYIIPNRVVYPTLFLCMGLLLFAALLQGDFGRLGGAFTGMAAAWFFFYVVWFVYPPGMGFGDVRLSAVIGLVTGWMGFGNVVLAVILALVIGAAAGVILMLLRLRGRKDAIPFGPFLAAGAALSVLFGQPIARWWLG